MKGLTDDMLPSQEDIAVDLLLELSALGDKVPYHQRERVNGAVTEFTKLAVHGNISTVIEDIKKEIEEISKSFLD
tara:strand:+ start:2186 stop:2410 length:225 start_codon:yes stop_codon:yes gene_type:complete